MSDVAQSVVLRSTSFVECSNLMLFQWYIGCLFRNVKLGPMVPSPCSTNHSVSIVEVSKSSGVVQYANARANNDKDQTRANRQVVRSHASATGDLMMPAMGLPMTSSYFTIDRETNVFVTFDKYKVVFCVDFSQSMFSTHEGGLSYDVVTDSLFAAIESMLEAIGAMENNGKEFHVSIAVIAHRPEIDETFFVWGGDLSRHSDIDTLRPIIIGRLGSTEDESLEASLAIPITKYPDMDSYVSAIINHLHLLPTDACPIGVLLTCGNIGIKLQSICEQLAEHRVKFHCILERKCLQRSASFHADVSGLKLVSEMSYGGRLISSEKTLAKVAIKESFGKALFLWPFKVGNGVSGTTLSKITDLNNYELEGASFEHILALRRREGFHLRDIVIEPRNIPTAATVTGKGSHDTSCDVLAIFEKPISKLSFILFEVSVVKHFSSHGAKASKALQQANKKNVNWKGFPFSEASLLWTTGTLNINIQYVGPQTSKHIANERVAKALATVVLGIVDADKRMASVQSALLSLGASPPIASKAVTPFEGTSIAKEVDGDDSATSVALRMLSTNLDAIESMCRLDSVLQQQFYVSPHQVSAADKSSSSPDAVLLYLEDVVTKMFRNVKVVRTSRFKWLVIVHNAVAQQKSARYSDVQRPLKSSPTAKAGSASRRGSAGLTALPEVITTTAPEYAILFMKLAVINSYFLELVVGRLVKSSGTLSSLIPSIARKFFDVLRSKQLSPKALTFNASRFMMTPLNNIHKAYSKSTFQSSRMDFSFQSPVPNMRDLILADVLKHRQLGFTKGASFNFHICFHETAQDPVVRESCEVYYFVAFHEGHPSGISGLDSIIFRKLVVKLASFEIEYFWPKGSNDPQYSYRKENWSDRGLQSAERIEEIILSETAEDDKLFVSYDLLIRLTGIPKGEMSEISHDAIEYMKALGKCTTVSLPLFTPTIGDGDVSEAPSRSILNEALMSLLFEQLSTQEKMNPLHVEGDGKDHQLQIHECDHRYGFINGILENSIILVELPNGKNSRQSTTSVLLYNISLPFTGNPSGTHLVESVSNSIQLIHKINYSRIVFTASARRISVHYSDIEMGMKNCHMRRVGEVSLMPILTKMNESFAIDPNIVDVATRNFIVASFAKVVGRVLRGIPGTDVFLCGHLNVEDVSPTENRSLGLVGNIHNDVAFAHLSLCFSYKESAIKNGQSLTAGSCYRNILSTAEDFSKSLFRLFAEIGSDLSVLSEAYVRLTYVANFETKQSLESAAQLQTSKEAPLSNLSSACYWYYQSIRALSDFIHLGVLHDTLIVSQYTSAFDSIETVKWCMNGLSVKSELLLELDIVNSFVNNPDTKKNERNNCAHEKAVYNYLEDELFKAMKMNKQGCTFYLNEWVSKENEGASVVPCWLLLAVDHHTSHMNSANGSPAHQSAMLKGTSAIPPRKVREAPSDQRPGNLEILDCTSTSKLILRVQLIAFGETFSNDIQMNSTSADILKSFESQILIVGRKINQKILLDDLYETRTSNPLLIIPTIRQQKEPTQASPTLSGPRATKAAIHTLTVYPVKSDKTTLTIPNNDLMQPDLSVANLSKAFSASQLPQSFFPGSFACLRQDEIVCAINTGTVVSFDTAMRYAEMTALSPFLISNCDRHFVSKDAAGNVYYFYFDSVNEKDAKNVKLGVYGIEPMDAHTKSQLRTLVEHRIVESTAKQVSITISRNTVLPSAYIPFMKQNGQSRLVTVRFSLPASVSDPYQYCVIAKQILVSSQALTKVVVTADGPRRTLVSNTEVLHPAFIGYDSTNQTSTFDHSVAAGAFINVDSDDDYEDIDDCPVASDDQSSSNRARKLIRKSHVHIRKSSWSESEIHPAFFGSSSTKVTPTEGPLSSSQARIIWDQTDFSLLYNLMSVGAHPQSASGQPTTSNPSLKMHMLSKPIGQGLALVEFFPTENLRSLPPAYLNTASIQSVIDDVANLQNAVLCEAADSGISTVTYSGVPAPSTTPPSGQSNSSGTGCWQIVLKIYPAVPMQVQVLTELCMQCFNQALQIYFLDRTFMSYQLGPRANGALVAQPSNPLSTLVSFSDYLRLSHDFFRWFRLPTSPLTSCGMSFIPHVLPKSAGRELHEVIAKTLQDHLILNTDIDSIHKVQTTCEPLFFGRSQQQNATVFAPPVNWSDLSNSVGAREYCNANIFGYHLYDDNALNSELIRTINRESDSTMSRSDSTSSMNRAGDMPSLSAIIPKPLLSGSSTNMNSNLSTINSLTANQGFLRDLRLIADADTSLPTHLPAWIKKRRAMLEINVSADGLYIFYWNIQQKHVKETKEICSRLSHIYSNHYHDQQARQMLQLGIFGKPHQNSFGSFATTSPKHNTGDVVDSSDATLEDLLTFEMTGVGFVPIITRQKIATYLNRLLWEKSLIQRACCFNYSDRTLSVVPNSYDGALLPRTVLTDIPVATWRLGFVVDHYSIPLTECHTNNHERCSIKNYLVVLVQLLASVQCDFIDDTENKRVFVIAPIPGIAAVCSFALRFNKKGDILVAERVINVIDIIKASFCSSPSAIQVAALQLDGVPSFTSNHGGIFEGLEHPAISKIRRAIKLSPVANASVLLGKRMISTNSQGIGMTHSISLMAQAYPEETIFHTRKEFYTFRHQSTCAMAVSYEDVKTIFERLFSHRSLSKCFVVVNGNSNRVSNQNDAGRFKLSSVSTQAITYRQNSPSSSPVPFALGICVVDIFSLMPQCAAMPLSSLGASFDLSILLCPSTDNLLRTGAHSVENTLAPITITVNDEDIDIGYKHESSPAANSSEDLIVQIALDRLNDTFKRSASFIEMQFKVEIAWMALYRDINVMHDDELRATLSQSLKTYREGVVTQSLGKFTAVLGRNAEKISLLCDLIGKSPLSTTSLVREWLIPKSLAGGNRFCIAIRGSSDNPNKYLLIVAFPPEVNEPSVYVAESACFDESPDAMSAMRSSQTQQLQILHHIMQSTIATKARASLYHKKY